MNPLTRPLTGIVAACLAAVLLAGCSDDDPEPQFADPTSGSPSTDGPRTNAPTTPAPDVPMTQAEVVTAFFDEFSKSISSGETSNFMALTTPACGDCETLRENLEGAYANGGYIEGGRWDLLSAEPRDGNRATWDVRVSASREKWFNKADRQIRTISEGVLSFAVYLAPRDGSYAIRKFRVR